ncbi:TRAP C4-dicarboxylate ABC transporter permease [Aeromicrobium sp. PE09-221]|nr:TRAP C4-dicarboxylate ABC transporter permease [Aeromicrobium sp. PE09-221]
MSIDARPRRLNLDLFIEVPAVVLTFAMMVHISLNAIMRAFWSAPLSNTLEITQYWYLPVIAFLGFIAAQRRGQHVSADLIYEMLPQVTKRWVRAVSAVVVGTVCAGFAWFGLQEALHSFEIRRTAGVSDMPAWPPYFLAPIAFGSLTIQFYLAAARAVLRDEEAAEAHGSAS